MGAREAGEAVYVELYPDFSIDVFGPIMQPGSSSHTAAPCRLGRLAYDLLGEEPRQIRVTVEAEGSFAGTFGVMNEDNAMLAGAMGFPPDDTRLFQARQIAQRSGIAYSFETATIEKRAHANASKLELTGREGRKVTLVGDSTGGGMIETRYVDGYPLRLRGDSYVLLIFDPQRLVTPARAERAREILPSLVGAGEYVVDGKGALYYFKTAEATEPGPMRRLFPGAQVGRLRPVLPVITRPGANRSSLTP